MVEVIAVVERRQSRHKATPGGGGGGVWGKFGEKRAESQAERARLKQTASLKGGTTFGLSIHPYDGTDPQTVASATGTSIFDPVICEIAYRWFCPPGGLVLDPFAGGSVRGVVASKLGRRYVGVDLSAEQVAANEQQAHDICDDPLPEWVVGDSRDIAELVGDKADFILSCPPYADLEVYSDDPRDLSNLDYREFREAYAAIITAACGKLRNNRFACFVVGDVRDPDGFYRNFPGHTIQAFEDAGLRLYNEAILVTAAGTLPLRVTRGFVRSRKLGKTHQQVYIFCKGDPRVATEVVGEVEFGEIVTFDPGMPTSAVDAGQGEFI